MQIHHNRTPWLPGPDGHPICGSDREQSEAVKAIHFGCSPDGVAVVEHGMLPSVLIEEWVCEQYRICWELVCERVSDASSLPEWRST